MSHKMEIMTTWDLRRLLEAQQRFGEYPSETIDPENKEFFENMMFTMGSAERCYAYMRMTREMRMQFWSYRADLKREERLRQAQA